MTVTNQESTQYANIFTTDPVVMNPASDWAGRLRVMHFTHDQNGAGDATSDVKLVRLPPGRVRVFWDLSGAYINWTTGSATFDLGWDAYTALDGSAVVADPNGILDGVDVETAGWFPFSGALTLAAGYSTEFISKGGVTLLGTSQDVALATGSDLAGRIVYAID